jgi:hypothetical protein
MDFKIGDRVRVCFPEDMRPLRWDSARGLMDGRTGTIVRCVSGFWVVRFDQPIEIVPGSYAEVHLHYGREIEQEPLAGMWLLKMGDVGGLQTMPIINAEKAVGHFADRTRICPPAPYTPMPAQS